MNLFNNLEEIQAFVPVNNSFDENQAFSYIKEALEDYLYENLSKEQVEDIIEHQDNYENETFVSLQRAAANFAFWLYSPKGLIQWNNQGAQEVSVEGQRPARAENLEINRKSFIDTGWKEIEKLLVTFEKDTTKFDKWAASEQFTVFSNHFITTATEFNSYLNIRKSRRVFMLLEASMQFVEDFEVEPFLTKALANAIKADRSQADNRFLIKKFIGPAIANLTMAKAIPNLAMTLGNFDTVLLFDNTGANQTKGGKTPGLEYLKSWQQSFEKTGNELIGYMVEYINQNLDKYPDYEQVAPAAPAVAVLPDSPNYPGDKIVGFF